MTDQTVTPDLDRVLSLVRDRGSRAQICVLREGHVVLDQAVGCWPDALFWLFSASKPFVALLVHLLAERRALSLDDRVAQHWPQFGRCGKEEITVRQVLAHRSGLPVARSAALDALAMTDWDRSVRHIERARPAWPPGQVPAYHYITYGFILGELIRRVTGAELPGLLTAEFLRPLDLNDIYLGLADAQLPRLVPVRGRGPVSAVSAAFVNQKAIRQAVIPAAGVSATARDLALFYQALLSGGELGGRRVLAPETVAQARRPSGNGETDRFLHLQIRWSHAFQLGGAPPGAPVAIHPMGSLSSPLTFGHNGSNCAVAWADPDRQLVVAYVTDALSASREAARHLSDVSDAVITAYSG